MPPLITHRPFSDEHPFEPGPDGRWPRSPKAGERLRIAARTDPLQGVARVQVRFWTGAEAGARVVDARREEGGWVAELPPCPAETLHYRLRAEGVAGEASTEVFTVNPRTGGRIGSPSGAGVDGSTVVIAHDGAWQRLSAAEPGELRIELGQGPAPAVAPLPVRGGRISFPLRDFRISMDTGAATLRVERSDGRLILEEISAPVISAGETEGTIEVRRSFRSPADEGFFGLGERFRRLNQRGSTVDTVVFDQFGRQGARSYIPVPFLLSSRGYAWWVDSRRRCEFDLADSSREAWSVTSSGPSVCSYLFVGEPAAAVGRFTARVGRPAAPPAWVFGPWMSSNEWNSQARVLAEVRRGRELDIPASVVVIEAWSDEQTFYLWNGARTTQRDPSKPVAYQELSLPADGPWPDPRAMSRELHEAGLKLVLWQIPVLKQRWGEHPDHEADERYAIEHGFCATEADGSPYRVRPGWFRGGMLFDFTNPQARQWWFGKRRYLVESCGVDGFKTDGGEHLWGREVRFHDGRRGDEMLNGFPLAYLAAYHEAMASWGRDPVTFSRAGYAGAGRFPCHWAGDQPSTWEAFRSVITAALNVGLSGVPFFGWDLAGFIGEVPTAELYLRSAACAAFSPIMQYHSDFNQHRVPRNDRTPWNVAEASGDPRVITVFRRFAKARMKLVPYLVQEAAWCAESGEPLMAPLLLRFADDAGCWAIDDQYLLGRALLVAPVLLPGVDHRELYVPAGDWEDAWTGERFAGPVRRTVPCPLDHIPVFRLRSQPWPLSEGALAAD